MRVFVTGATGFIGAAVVKELIAAGHQVTGLCRSADKAAALKASGADVLLGTLADADVLARGIAQSDGVIHLGFNHDFSTYQQNCEDDRKVIRLMGSYLAGSNRPLVVTSGASMTSPGPGQLSLEDGKPITSDLLPRAASEEAAAEAAAQGVNVSVVRLPQVHNTEKQGFVSYLVAVTREKGYCAYIGDGQVRWSAAHVLDVARLYRLAIEKAAPDAKYHAVAEESVKIKDIAEAIGHRLNLPVKSITPEEAESYYGWLAFFAAFDAPSSSAQTRKALGWTPSGPGMIDDLRNLSA